MKHKIVAVSRVTAAMSGAVVFLPIDCIDVHAKKYHA